MSLSGPRYDWSQSDAPAANTAASTSRLAPSNEQRHVCTSITATLSAVAASGNITYVLRAGATGVGPIIWSASLIAPAGNGRDITLAGLRIAGALGAAMTLETTGAPGATNFATVAMSGVTEPIF